MEEKALDSEKAVFLFVKGEKRNKTWKAVPRKKKVPSPALAQKASF